MTRLLEFRTQRKRYREVQCPVCEVWLPWTGPQNVFVHLVTHHPTSPEARLIWTAIDATGGDAR